MSVDLEKNKYKILEVYNDVLEDKTSTDWALFGYEGQTNVLKVVESGDYGIEEMSDDLNASKIMYGIVRVKDPKTSRIKIVLINWQGEGAPNLRKGVCARHLHDVKRMFKGVHITVTARTEDDIDASIILESVAKATSTEYNFSDRSELPEKTVPVGTNYKRTNPQSEINANNRNKFWEEQEVEEKVRKEIEMKKREEETKNLEKERIAREIQDCKHREQLNKERNARIVAEKKAESVAYSRTAHSEDQKVWQKELDKQHDEEVHRARRADQMRMERKKEAESLIGHRTHFARSVFETQSNPSPQATDTRNRPPPRKLKEFNPSNVDSASNAKENLAPKRSIGARWPPPAAEEPTPITTNSTVPGKISEWKPLVTAEAQKEKISVAQEIKEKPVKEKLIETKPQSHLVSNTDSEKNQMASNHRNICAAEDDWSPQKLTSPPEKVCDEKVPVSVQQQIQKTEVFSPPPAFTTTSESPVKQIPSPLKMPPLETHFDQPVSPEVLNGHNGVHTNGGIREEEAPAPHYDAEVNQEDLNSFSMMYEVDGVEYQILTEHGLCARALYDYQAADETEITFDPGDIITNIEQIDVGWWQGVSAMGLFGLFPANYVELINGTAD